MADSEDSGPLSQEEIDEIYNREWKKAGSFSADSVKIEGKHVFAEICFPGGGVYEDGVLMDSALIRAGSAKDNMLLMNSDFAQDEALKRMVTRQVQSLGDISEQGEITRMVREGLLIGDYNYLVFKIRQLTVGDKVVFSSTCRKCGNTHEYNIMISELEFEVPEGFDPADGNTRFRQFEFDFWGAKWKVNWHFATEGDVAYLKRMIEAEIKRLSKGDRKDGKGKTRRHDGVDKPEQGPIDYRYIVSGGESKIDFITSNLLSRVDSILEPTSDGEGKLVQLGRSANPTPDVLSTHQSLDYLKELPSPLALELWKQIDASEPSMDTEIIYECLTCGEENSEVIHPLSPNFFFPSEIQLG